MQLIETKTLGTAAAAIEFTSIPSTFTDLVVLAGVRQNSRNAANGGFVFRMVVNGSTANSSSRSLRGSGSAVSSFTDTDIIFYGNASDFSGGFGSTNIYIPNYTAAVAKSISVDSVSENNATLSYQLISAGLWNSTAAISSLKFEGLFGDNLVADSSISLYGITKGSGGATVS